MKFKTLIFKWTNQDPCFFFIHSSNMSTEFVPFPSTFVAQEMSELEQEVQGPITQVLIHRLMAFLPSESTFPDWFHRAAASICRDPSCAHFAQAYANVLEITDDNVVFIQAWLQSMKHAISSSAVNRAFLWSIVSSWYSQRMIQDHPLEEKCFAFFATTPGSEVLWQSIPNFLDSCLFGLMTTTSTSFHQSILDLLRAPVPGLLSHIVKPVTLETLTYLLRHSSDSVVRKKIVTLLSSWRSRGQPASSILSVVTPHLFVLLSDIYVSANVMHLLHQCISSDPSLIAPLMSVSMLWIDHCPSTSISEDQRQKLGKTPGFMLVYVLTRHLSSCYNHFQNSNLSEDVKLALREVFRQGLELLLTLFKLQPCLRENTKEECISAVWRPFMNMIVSRVHTNPTFQELIPPS